MNTQWIPIAVAALSLALSAGCKNGNQEPSTTQTTAAQPTLNGATAKHTLSEDDKEFMTKAAQGGMLEVALGREAAQKATSPDVKAFGTRMVTDHTKAGDELKLLSAQKGVILPTQLDKDHQSKIDEMSRLSGAKLDKEYADDMVDDHEEDVKEFKKASQDVKDPDLRAWAAKTLPVLESHLAMAKDVEAKVKHAK